MLASRAQFSFLFCEEVRFNMFNLISITFQVLHNLLSNFASIISSLTLFFPSYKHILNFSQAYTCAYTLPTHMGNQVKILISTLTHKQALIHTQFHYCIRWPLNFRVSALFHSTHHFPVLMNVTCVRYLVRLLP